MRLPLQRSALVAASTLVCSLAPCTVPAATYPNQAIKFVIPAPAGGLPDTVARIVGRRLQERIGQPVVVENRPGGNASVAAVVLEKAPADGYTFMVQDGSVVSVNPLIYGKLAYMPQDLQPVSLLVRAPLFLAVSSKVPVESMKEFVAYVKARPDQLDYGSSGVGSTHHLTMEAIKAALNLRMTHVPYKGTGESVPALLGGQVHAVFAAYPTLGHAVDEKRIRLLATNGAAPSPQAPDVPPLANFIPGFDFAPVIGIYARSGTPSAIVQRLASEAGASVLDHDVIGQLKAVGLEPVGGGPEEFDRALKSEIERVAAVVRAAGIRAE